MNAVLAPRQAGTRPGGQGFQSLRQRSLATNRATGRLCRCKCRWDHSDKLGVSFACHVILRCCRIGASGLEVGMRVWMMRERSTVNGERGTTRDVVFGEARLSRCACARSADALVIVVTLVGIQKSDAQPWYVFLGLHPTLPRSCLRVTTLSWT